jgi:hypothetical protein
MRSSDITLHGVKIYGHVRRVQLLLDMLERPYHYIETSAHFMPRSKWSASR